MLVEEDAMLPALWEVMLDWVVRSCSQADDGELEMRVAVACVDDGVCGWDALGDGVGIGKAAGALAAARHHHRSSPPTC